MCTFSLSSLFATHDFYRACLTGFPTSWLPNSLWKALQTAQQVAQWAVLSKVQ